MIKISKGLDLPISGAPQQQIADGPTIRSVAVVGTDYVGMKPTMAVQQGDQVKKGQLLFSDKKTPGVKYTAPAGGTIAAINRGEKRVLQSIVIDIEGDEAISFDAFSAEQQAGLSREQIVNQLVESGLWTALRTRPFSKVPAPDSQPAAIFVNTMDSNPLAADPTVVIAEQAEAFNAGLDLLARLTEGSLFVTQAPGESVHAAKAANIINETFAGPHPAGLIGTHIHTLCPASDTRTVWHIGYQDVIAVAKLFTTGELNTDRVVALAGPRVSEPRLLRTRIGASTDELTAGQLETDGQENRVISGSVLSGQVARGAFAYLGRYATQISVIQEDRSRNLLEYMSIGTQKHSKLNVYLSKFMPSKRFDMTTSTNGSPRAIVPVGSYEEVMPLDILPVQLMRSLVVGDIESAQALGALELDEEDLALLTYVCPGKYEYGPILRDNLTRIEKEG